MAAGAVARGRGRGNRSAQRATRSRGGRQRRSRPSGNGQRCQQHRRYFGAAVGITLFVVIATHVGHDLAAGWNAAIGFPRGSRWSGRAASPSRDDRPEPVRRHVLPTARDLNAVRRPRRLLRPAPGLRPGGVTRRLAGGDDDRRTQRRSAPNTSAPYGNSTPRAQRPRARLTRGAKGEAAPAFTADGDLLFVAARHAPTAATATSRPRRCGGSPPPAARPSRCSRCPAASTACTPPAAPTSPSSRPRCCRRRTDVDDDKRLRALRKDTKVSAVLHTGYPVRHWDHDIGPAQPHLLGSWGAGA